MSPEFAIRIFSRKGTATKAGVEASTIALGAGVGILLAIVDRGRPVRLVDRYRCHRRDEQGPGKPLRAIAALITGRVQGLMQSSRTARLGKFTRQVVPVLGSAVSGNGLSPSAVLSIRRFTRCRPQDRKPQNPASLFSKQNCLASETIDSSLPHCG